MEFFTKVTQVKLTTEESNTLLKAAEIIGEIQKNMPFYCEVETEYTKLSSGELAVMVETIESFGDGPINYI